MRKGGGEVNCRELQGMGLAKGVQLVQETGVPGMSGHRGDDGVWGPRCSVACTHQSCLLPSKSLEEVRFKAKAGFSF